MTLYLFHSCADLVSSHLRLSYSVIIKDCNQPASSQKHEPVYGIGFYYFLFLIYCAALCLSLLSLQKKKKHTHFKLLVFII